MWPYETSLKLFKFLEDSLHKTVLKYRLSRNHGLSRMFSKIQKEQIERLFLIQLTYKLKVKHSKNDLIEHISKLKSHFRSEFKKRSLSKILFGISYRSYRVRFWWFYRKCPIIFYDYYNKDAMNLRILSTQKVVKFVIFQLIFEFFIS